MRQACCYHGFNQTKVTDCVNDSNCKITKTSFAFGSS